MLHKSQAWLQTATATTQVATTAAWSRWGPGRASLLRYISALRSWRKWGSCHGPETKPNKIQRQPTPGMVHMPVILTPSKMAKLEFGRHTIMWACHCIDNENGSKVAIQVVHIFNFLNITLRAHVHMCHGGCVETRG